MAFKSVVRPVLYGTSAGLTAALFAVANNPPTSPAVCVLEAVLLAGCGAAGGWLVAYGPVRFAKKQKETISRIAWGGLVGTLVAPATAAIAGLVAGGLAEVKYLNGSFFRGAVYGFFGSVASLGLPAMVAGAVSGAFVAAILSRLRPTLGTLAMVVALVEVGIIVAYVVILQSPPR